MMNRISAVISQSPDGNSASRSLEENLVAGLLMENGVDVNVVPHLASLQTDSTGLLCLEGTNGDMILLSWLDPRKAHRILGEKGIQGRFGTTKFGDDAIGDEDDSVATVEDCGLPQRTIYHVDLRAHDTVAPLQEEIRRIRDKASVKTFDFVPLLSQPTGLERQNKGGGKAEAEIGMSLPVVSAAGPPSPRVAESQRDENLGADVPEGDVTPPGARIRTSDEQEEPKDELDSLIDELDQLDL
jgi:hypothetical protein